MAILVGFTATLLHGGFVTLDGGMAIASYSVMIFMMQRLLWPLTRLGETFDLYQRAMVSTTRVLDLLGTKITLVEGDKELDISTVKGAIHFEDVNFGYPGRDEVISGFSLDIKPGTTQAIVGPTGSGKTIVIRLFLRFHDPSSGNIFLDGNDIRDLRVKSLRSAVSLVTQTITLFPGSVMQNIAYGKEGATDDGCLAASGGADYRLSGTRLDIQTETANHLVPPGIAKIDILEMDSSLDGRDIKFLITFDKSYLGPQQVKDPRGRHHRSLIEIECLTQSCQGPE
jgi:ATP-binding cassette subfamily B protein